MGSDSDIRIRENLQRIEPSRRSGETVREYAERVAKRHDLSPDDVDQFRSLLCEYLYSGRGLTERKKKRLETYVSEMADEPTREPQSTSDSERTPRRQAETVRKNGGSDADQRLHAETRPRSTRNWRSSFRGLVTSFWEREIRTIGSSRYPSSEHLPGARVWLDLAVLLPLLALAAYVFFYELGAYPIRGWDEGTFANLARHMARDGYWLVPHMNFFLGNSPTGFGPWMEKPPLVFWIQGITMSLVGVNEFAVRFQSAFFGVCTVGLVYVFGRELKSRFAGFVSGVVYLTTPFVYSGFDAARTGGVDSAHTFFGSLFVFFVWRAVATTEDRWLRYAGLVGGLTVMVKGFAAGIFVFVVLPLVVRHRKLFASRRALEGIALTAMISLPWPLYMYLRFGDAFVDVIFFEQVLSRATGDMMTYSGATFEFMKYPYFTHLWEAEEFYHPWIFFVVGSVPAAALRLLRGERRDHVFVVWWTGIVLGFFAFVGNHPWYLMPLFVPGALFVGLSTSYAIAGRIGASAGVLAGAVLALDYSSAYALTSERGIVLLALAICVVGFGVFRSHVRSRVSRNARDVGQAVLSVSLAVLVVGAFVGTPPLLNQGDFWSQQKRMGNWVQEEVPADETVYVENGIGVMHSFAFYAQRPTSGLEPEYLPANVSYAVVKTSSLDDIEREYSVIYDGTNRRQNISLISFGERTTNRAGVNDSSSERSDDRLLESRVRRPRRGTAGQDAPVVI